MNFFPIRLTSVFAFGAVAGIAMALGIPAQAQSHAAGAADQAMAARLARLENHVKTLESQVKQLKAQLDQKNANRSTNTRPQEKLFNTQLPNSFGSQGFRGPGFGGSAPNKLLPMPHPNIPRYSNIPPSEWIPLSR